MKYIMIAIFVMFIGCSYIEQTYQHPEPIDSTYNHIMNTLDSIQMNLDSMHNIIERLDIIEQKIKQDY